MENELHTNNSISFTIPSNPKYLALVRRIVGWYCKSCACFPSQEIHGVTLAVDEACSNIIKYNYDGKTDNVIVIRLILSDNNFKVFIRDYGKCPKLAEIKPRDLRDVRPGGLGVHFMESVMDSITYDTSFNKGCMLIMSKCRGPWEGK